MTPRFPVLAPLLAAIAIPAQETSTPPVETASALPSWKVSLSQRGQAGDTSASHQTALSLAWTGRWEEVRFVPSLRAVRSGTTSPDSTWFEVEPAAKLRIALGSSSALTLAGWSTLVQEPRDLGGSARLAGEAALRPGDALGGWGELRASLEGGPEGGVGTGLEHGIGERLTLSATAGGWWSRPTFPSGKQGSAFAPEWTCGLGATWDEESWSLALAGDWTSIDAEREVKASSKKILSSLVSATERIHQEDWLLSLDATWEPLDPLSLWTSLSWRWVREEGGIALEGLSTGSSKKLSATDVSTIEDGPGWEVGVGWSW